jgi:hypothetical protein
MVRFDKQFATILLDGQAQLSEHDPGDPSWIEKIEKFSQLCEGGVSQEHIAFLGTAILAKALDSRAHLFALKSTPDETAEEVNALPARTLCHTVLVPLAAGLGIDLGVKSREPLNHQPYLRMKRLDDRISIRPADRVAFDYMVELVRQLQGIRESVDANSVLRAFIAVRRRYHARDVEAPTAIPIKRASLIDAVAKLLAEDPEDATRARAVLAGLLDVFVGVVKVEIRGNHAPKQAAPRDVCMRWRSGNKGWETVFEIHDGPVTDKEIRRLADKCVSLGAPKAAIVQTAGRPARLDVLAFRVLAQARNVDLVIFDGWAELVDQILFWSELPEAAALQNMIAAIRARLVQEGASSTPAELWQSLTTTDAARESVGA